jgi:ATP:ADP antiporter, AAA family
MTAGGTGMTAAAVPIPGRRSAVERVLTVFTDVRPGEGVTLLLLAANSFGILSAYYMIKPVREALILAAAHGAELKSYASAVQALILLLVAVPLYARLAGRLSRRRLLNSVNLFFIANLGLFYLALIAGGTGRTWLGFVFFVWVGIFNLMVPAQLWSLANDVYDTAQGERLFAVVAAGASLGGVLGGVVTKRLIGPIGIEALLLVSAGILVASHLLTSVIEARERRRLAERSAASARAIEEPLSKQGAFALVFRTRYLLLISLLMLMLNWVNTNGEFILSRKVEEIAKAEVASEVAAGTTGDVSQRVGKRIGSFYAGQFTLVNITGLAIQLLLVSRIVKYLGVRVAILILPTIALAGYSLILAVPALRIIRVAKIAENATDYSVQNTVRQALFLPTTREDKYKAKQAIDTFFWRAGDVLSALLVYTGLHIVHWTPRGFAFTNITLVLVWIGLAIAVGAEYARRSQRAA